MLSGNAPVAQQVEHLTVKICRNQVVAGSSPAGGAWQGSVFMQEKMKTILSAFDIRKLGTECNYPGCASPPEFKLSLRQRSHRRGERALASIFVCRGHMSEVERLAERLRNESPGMLIEFHETEIKKGR